nr:hypothetical protein [Tanacetum cinerariifolium]
MATNFNIQEYELMEKPLVIAVYNFQESAIHYYLDSNIPETYHIKQQYLQMADTRPILNINNQRNKGSRCITKTCALNWNTLVRSMMKRGKWNQDLRKSEKLLRFYTRSLRGLEIKREGVEYEDSPNRDEGRVERNFKAAPSNNYPYYTQPMYPLPNPLSYPNYGPTGLFADSTGCVTPFVYWIEDCPLPKGLEMPSHVGSYDRKGDPNNYCTSLKVQFLCRNGSRREILAMEKVAKMFKQPPHMIISRRLRDMTKYCHFHEGHGHDTNVCWELKHQIEEAVKSDQDTTPVEAPILMISREDHTLKRKSTEELVNGLGEITFPPVSETFKGAPRWLLGRTFLASRRSPIGDHNKRTNMQRMGIVVSTISRAIKFHTPRGIDTIFSTHEPDNIEETKKKTREAPSKVTNFKEKLRVLLKVNADIFAWTYTGMTRIPRNIMRLVDKVFGDQIGRNLEAYIDDMVIKSTYEEEMLMDLDRNKGQPVKSQRSVRPGTTKDAQGYTEPQWEAGST